MLHVHTREPLYRGIWLGELKNRIQHVLGVLSPRERAVIRWRFGLARGRPVGVAVDRTGGVLVADDVGNVVWRVAPRLRASARKLYPEPVPASL